MPQQIGAKSRSGDASDSLRTVFAVVCLNAGTDFLQYVEGVPRREAFLFTFVVVVVLLLLLPSRNLIEARPIVFNLILLVTGYGILAKFRPWLAAFTTPLLATVISIAIILSLAFTCWTLFRRWRQARVKQTGSS